MAWDKVSPTQWMSGTNISGQVLVPKEGVGKYSWHKHLWASTRGTNISGQVLVPKEGFEHFEGGCFEHLIGL